MSLNLLMLSYFVTRSASLTRVTLDAGRLQETCDVAYQRRHTSYMDNGQHQLFSASPRSALAGSGKHCASPV